MKCTHNPERRSQEDEFTLKTDFGELSILGMGAEYISLTLKRIPIGDFTNGMDEESREEMREVADQIVKDLDTLQDAAVLNDKK